MDSASGGTSRAPPSWIVSANENSAWRRAARRRARARAAREEPAGEHHERELRRVLLAGARRRQEERARAGEARRERARGPVTGQLEREQEERGDEEGPPDDPDERDHGLRAAAGEQVVWRVEGHAQQHRAVAPLHRRKELPLCEGPLHRARSCTSS